MKHTIVGSNSRAPKGKTLYKILKSSCKSIYGNELFHVDGHIHIMKLKSLFTTSGTYVPKKCTATDQFVENIT